MAKTQLGKVAIVPRGAYDASATYEPLDVVSYNGGSYMARQQSTGITPAEGDDWQKLVDVTSSGVKTALGYTPEPLSKYELIEMIDVGDEKITIVRTEEPNGTAYAFDGAIILGKCPIGKTAALFSGTMYTNYNRSETIWSATGGTYSDVRWAHSIWEKWGGKWRRGRSTAWNRDDDFIQDGMLYVRALTGANIYSGEYINKISFSAGAGLVFYIYARRKGT